MVLTSVRAYLMLETEFTIHTYSEPEEAVKHMQNNPVDVVVSDYLMPRMSGIQFLMKARELQPEVSRVLLTGHADMRSTIAELATANTSLKDVQKRLLRAFL